MTEERQPNTELLKKAREWLYAQQGGLNKPTWKRSIELLAAFAASIQEEDDEHKLLDSVGVPSTESDGMGGNVFLSLESRIKLLVAENTRLRQGLNIQAEAQQQIEQVDRLEQARDDEVFRANAWKARAEIAEKQLAEGKKDALLWQEIAADYGLKRDAAEAEVIRLNEQLAEARAQEGKLWKLLKDICRNAYACHFQQGESESDPCRQCANCRADKALGRNWRAAEEGK